MAAAVPVVEAAEQLADRAQRGEAPPLTFWPGPRSAGARRLDGSSGTASRGVEGRPCAGMRTGTSVRATFSSARPISQSRLGTTSPAGVKAIFRSSAWLPESLRHSPATMSTASSGLPANSRPA
ncbi:hypothetical protein STENM327S_00858 [Streptomyces tendae]